MMKKIVIGFVLVVLMVGFAGANIVSSSDKTDPFPAKFYVSKYAPVNADPSTYGRVTIHSGSSPLTQVTNDTDYWPPVAMIYNNKNANVSEKVVVGMDGAVTDIYAPGDFTLTYRYCKIPVKVSAGQETIVGLPVCDR